jgi:hypothetical protein
VRGSLELSDDGMAMKYFQLLPFDLRVTAETIVEALASDDGLLEALDTKENGK